MAYPPPYPAQPGYPGAQPTSYPAQPGYPGHQPHYPPPAGAPPHAPYGAPPTSSYPAAYPPPAGAPYGAPPAHHAPYGAPPASPYGPPPGAPPATHGYPPHAHPPAHGYPPPAHPPASHGYPAPTPPPTAHGYPGASYPPPAAPYGAHAPPAPYGHPTPAAPSPYPIPQHAMAPMNVPPPPQGWSMHHNPYGPVPTNFQLSNCTGRKRALFIGINYIGQQGQLRGCINDVKNIKKFVIERYGFKEQDTITLTDDQRDTTRIPTRANMIAAMQWLVRDARPNDSFFFHYSGHGGQTDDLDGDEDDGKDETILPVDHKTAGVIIDDVLHAIMVQPLPAGCRLTAVMDCCHSGSAMDLPYIYSTTGQLKGENMLSDVGSGVLNAGKMYLMGNLGGAISSVSGIGKRITGNNKAAKQKKSSPADVIMFSGCKDTQTSMDTHEQGFGMTGAMTFSMITALTMNPNQSYLQLLNSIRDILRTKYAQKPQLSSSHPVDLNLLFKM